MPNGKLYLLSLALLEKALLGPFWSLNIDYFWCFPTFLHVFLANGPEKSRHCAKKVLPSIEQESKCKQIGRGYCRNPN